MLFGARGLGVVVVVKVEVEEGPGARAYFWTLNGEAGASRLLASSVLPLPDVK